MAPNLRRKSLDFEGKSVRGSSSIYPEMKLISWGNVRFDLDGKSVCGSASIYPEMKLIS